MEPKLSEFPGKDLHGALAEALRAQAEILRTQHAQMEREMGLTACVQYIVGLMSSEDRAAFRDLVGARMTELDAEFGPSEVRSATMRSMIASAKDRAG